MEKTITVHLTDCDVTCHFASLDEDIQKPLERLRLFLKDHCDIYNLDYSLFNVYYYDSNAINAFCTKYDNRYLIAISKAVFKDIKSDIEDFFHDDEFLKMINNPAPDYYDYLITGINSYVLNFILLHEFFHIVNGHLGKSNFIEELNNDTLHPPKIDKEKYFSQLCEYDADFYAINTMTEIILNEVSMRWKSQNKDVIGFEMNKLVFLSVSLCTVFSLFYKKNINPDISTLFLSDHPNPCIRYRYSIEIIGSYLLTAFGFDCFIYLQSHLTNIGIACNRIFYASNNFPNSLLCVAYSRIGTIHRMKLHNDSLILNDIYMSLRKIPVVKKEILDTALFYVDDYNQIFNPAKKIWITEDEERFYEELLK